MLLLLLSLLLVLLLSLSLLLFVLLVDSTKGLDDPTILQLMEQVAQVASKLRIMHSDD